MVFFLFRLFSNPIFIPFILQNTIECFDPELRNLVSLGRSYEKAVQSKTFFFFFILFAAYSALSVVCLLVFVCLCVFTLLCYRSFRSPICFVF